MTEKPWCLADLMFEPMGDDLREKATINGVEIVREDGRYWIRTEKGPHYDDLAEDGVDASASSRSSARSIDWPKSRERSFGSPAASANGRRPTSGPTESRCTGASVRCQACSITLPRRTAPKSARSGTAAACIVEKV